MENRDALVIVDMQKGVCNNAHDQIYNLDHIVTKINDKIESYSNQKKPVIFIQHVDEDLMIDSDTWQIIDEINSNFGTHFVNKSYANAFYRTEFKKFLEDKDVQSFEICGAQTEYCMDATIKFAHGLAYDIYMQEGMSTTYDNEFLTASETISFFQKVWDKRFLTLYK